MKKENRQLAKARKAQEKKKTRQKQMIKKGLWIVIPILVILLFICLSSTYGNQNSTSTVTAADTDETMTATALNTDTSLVVEDGDMVNIDYVGTIDGVEFSGGNTGGMGTDLTIGSGMYIDDFEDQLIGYHIGDTVKVVVTFPENYGSEDLNGKEAIFTTTINGIYK